MSEIIKTYKKRNKEIRIYKDDCSESPRDWDNVGHMICFHREYDLGDKHDLKRGSFDSLEELRDYLIKELKAVVILPLNLYDHSGIGISTTTKYPYNCQWDSSKIGFSYATKEDIKEAGITKKKAEQILIGEVETYDQYLGGEIYRFEHIKLIKCKSCNHMGEEFLDGCGGFYGADPLENGMSEHVSFKGYKEVEE